HLPAHVRRVRRFSGRAEDLPPLDRELRDGLDGVVLLLREAARRPHLPVRRAHDERDQQDERERGHARDPAVHSTPLSALARFDASMSRASIRKFATTLEPPYETNGSVIPVSGMIRRIPPTMMKVWRAKPKMRPTASSLENPSLARSEIRKPRMTKSM